MAKQFENTDSDFRQMSAEELAEAERELRRRKINITLAQMQVSPGGVIIQKKGARGTVGSPVSKIVYDYRTRVEAAGGKVEALGCVHAALQRLYKM